MPHIALRGAALLVVGCSLMLIACAGGEQTPTAKDDSTTPPADTSVTVTTSDMSFDPELVTVSPGAVVEIVLDNPDRIVHDFTVDDFVGERIHLEARPRSEARLVLTMPATPGEWHFYCSVPGHEELGMTGVLEVR